jgi:hypothetical protein
MLEAIKEIGEMKVHIKMRDVFYNNGITNIFWAALKSYDAEYESNDSILYINIEGVKLTLKPFLLEIKGKDEDVRKWYRKTGTFLTNVGLFPIKRLVYSQEDGRLKEGYSYGIRPFALRTWGSSIGAKFISGPSLRKNLSDTEKEKVRHAINDYQEKIGKDIEQLDKEKLFKKNWAKEGVYISVKKEKIMDKLLGERYKFTTGENSCEICSSQFTTYGKKEFKRDTSVVPTVIGLNYAGFKDLTIGKNLVCAFCDLVLRYNFFWTFYAKTNKTIVLHIDIPDLIVLYQLKELFHIKMEDITDEDVKQSTNIPYQGFYLSSTERAILSLTLFVYKRIKEASKTLQLLFAKKKNFLQIVGIFFDETGIHQFIQYHKLSKFLDFLDNLQSIKFIGDVLGVNSFSLIKGSQKDIYEKELLSTLLEFHPIAHNLSEIAFLKIKGDIYPLYLSRDFENMIITFYQFLKKEETMEKSAIELIRKYGWSLGTIAKAIDDRGVFYELREAKQIEQFIKVLRDFSFKMIKKAEELKGQFDTAALNIFTSKDQEFVNLLNEKGDIWEEIRDLFSFFSVNTYLKGALSTKKQNSQTQEV